MEAQNDDFQHKSLFQKLMFSFHVKLPQRNMGVSQNIRGPENQARLTSQMLCWDPTIQHPQYTNYSWWRQFIWTLYIQCDTIVTSDDFIKRSEADRSFFHTKLIRHLSYLFADRVFFPVKRSGKKKTAGCFFPAGAVFYRGSGQSAVTCNLLPSTSRVQVLSIWLKVHGVAETTVASPKHQPSCSESFRWKHQDDHVMIIDDHVNM